MRNGTLLGKTAAVLLLLAMVWSVWTAVEAPMLASVARDRLTIAEASALLHEQTGGTDRVGVLRAQRASIERFVDATSWSLDRSSPELLSARLQQAVEGYAGASGASVASSRTVAVQAHNGLAMIGLDFDVQATLPALQALLLKIDAARPRIFVDRLTVQVAENGGTAKGVDGQSELGVVLHVAIYGAPRARRAAS